MAVVEVTINGMLYDKLNRTTQNVVLIGEASLTGLGVGGGPLPGGPGDPPHPAHPIAGGPWPSHPIFYPPGTRPPWNGGGGGGGGTQPPINVPPPGSPPVVIGGDRDHIYNPIAIPPFIIVNYPGIGLVMVPVPKQGGNGTSPPPDMGNIGPAHPIQPTVPEPKE